MLKAVCGTAKGGAMPLGSYTLVHTGAKLSPGDVRALCDWTRAESARLASAPQATALEDTRAPASSGR